jgi:DNA topoisomerase-3
LASEKLTYFSNNQDVDVNRPGKRVFDTTKLTDHHAIIPLNKYSGSNTEEQNIFNLILKAFISAFMKPHTYEETKLTFSTKLENIVLTSRGKTVIENGWKSFNAQEENENEKPTLLPIVKEGDNCSLIDTELQLKYTEPPKHLTEDTLLGIMDKYNLGTPATRAHIIERLFTVSYLKRDKKNIVATEKGLELISILTGSNCNLYDVDITSQWENNLDLIYKNNAHSQGYKDFIATVSKFTQEQIENLKGTAIEVQSTNQATPKMINLAKSIAKEKGIKDFNKEDTSFNYVKSFIDKYIKAESNNPCPCGGIIKEDKFYYLCETCKKKVSKEICKKTITLKTASELFKGKKVLVKGMTSKKGSKFDAELELKDNKIKFPF